MNLNWTFIRDVGAGKFLWRTARRQFAKRALRRDSQLRLPTGLTIELPRWSGSASEVFVTDADTDWGSEALLVRHLDRDGCVLDVGANIGYYAMLCAPCVRTVYAFEPDPRNWPYLERNAARAGNVVVVRAAAHRACGEMTLELGENSAVSRLAPAGTSGKALRTPVTTLDSFVQDRPPVPVTAIKIDVEGEDLAVLEGAAGLLARDAPLVLTEFTAGESRSNTASALFDLLDRVDYLVYAFVRAAPPASWTRPRFRLSALDRGRFAGCEAKMLFLVPPRLRPAFAAAAVCASGGDAGAALG